MQILALAKATVNVGIVGGKMRKFLEKIRMPEHGDSLKNRF